jgi:hypothetical protein
MVAHLVEALRSNQEGRGFGSQRCHWNLSLIYFFRPRYEDGVESASNIKEYQQHFLGVKAVGA